MGGNGIDEFSDPGHHVVQFRGFLSSRKIRLPGRFQPLEVVTSGIPSNSSRITVACSSGYSPANSTPQAPGPPVTGKESLRPPRTLAERISDRSPEISRRSF